MATRHIAFINGGTPEADMLKTMSNAALAQTIEQGIILFQEEQAARKSTALTVKGLKLADAEYTRRYGFSFHLDLYGIN